MKHIVVCMLFIASLSAAQKKNPKEIYEADAAKVRQGDVNFDWLEFRTAAAGGGAKGIDWHPLRAQFMKNLNAGKTDAALKIAQEIKDGNMADPEGYLLAMVAYQKQDKQVEANQEKAAVTAFLRSIANSGDGKSATTAYVVVNTDEEYVFLRFVKNVGFPEKQSLVRKDGHAYDLLAYKTESGSTEESWFNIDISMAELEKALGGIK